MGWQRYLLSAISLLSFLIRQHKSHSPGCRRLCKTFWKTFPVRYREQFVNPYYWNKFLLLHKTSSKPNQPGNVGPVSNSVSSGPEIHSLSASEKYLLKNKNQKVQKRRLTRQQQSTGCQYSFRANHKSRKRLQKRWKRPRRHTKTLSKLSVTNEINQTTPILFSSYTIESHKIRQCGPIHDNDNAFPSLSTGIQTSIVPTTILKFNTRQQLANCAHLLNQEDGSDLVSSFHIEQFNQIKNELDWEKRITGFMESLGKLWVEECGSLKEAQQKHKWNWVASKHKTLLCQYLPQNRLEVMNMTR